MKFILGGQVGSNKELLPSHSRKQGYCARSENAVARSHYFFGVK
jgi:hypothetical protein